MAVGWMAQHRNVELSHGKAVSWLSLTWPVPVKGSLGEHGLVDTTVISSEGFAGDIRGICFFSFLRDLYTQVVVLSISIVYHGDNGSFNARGLAKDL